jgi:predicted HTH domain antitoxin
MENLSVDLERKVKALVSGGYYSSKVEVIKDAVKRLFRENAELNISAAIELYRNSEVSISKTAEIAGVTTIEFKEILAKRGIGREIKARPTAEMDKKLKNILNDI